MEGGEQVIHSATPAAAVDSTDGHPTASPPPLADCVGAAASDDVVAESEIHAPISDEEHEHEHVHGNDDENDHEHEHEHEHDIHEDHDLDHDAVEYYFSDENLLTDKYLLGFVRRNKEGFVPITVIASFRRMKKLTRDHAHIVDALKESSLLVVSGDGKRVKRLNPLRFDESRDHKLFTVLVENLPEDHSKKNIQEIFHEAGNIKRISIHDPHSTSESAKHIKQEMLISNKLHALVEYDSVEAAEKAVSMFNNEQDWRNGMQVKLLKRMVKYGHKKQAWKGSNSEKNSSSHVSEQTGDEEHHGSNEHHEDTLEEEAFSVSSAMESRYYNKPNGVLTYTITIALQFQYSVDRGGQRYRNQGRSRKHKYRAGNGMGHGSTPSTHAAEASKPPPGPRMPDGTRGFAVGRGRPPVPASN
ncbi:hypothetical protein Fmac_009082 [Flemingia macrophylla]|uniref:La-related protein 6A n=1 Tax=Flemingia macrophylla TaxID=520843 RepID=A0ABD1MZ89_9FABA